MSFLGYEDIPQLEDERPEGNFISSKKVLLLGNPEVGKTTLINSYLGQDKLYPAFTDDSHFQMYYTEFLFEDQIKSLVFYEELNGIHDFTPYRYFNLNVDLVVFCFSIDDLISLGSVVDFWAPKEMMQRVGFMPTVLLGLKMDIKHNSIVDRVACDIVEEKNLLHYTKCSAITGEGDLFKCSACFDGSILEVLNENDNYPLYLLYRKKDQRFGNGFLRQFDSSTFSMFSGRKVD
ncbi:hypothetical protein NPIL_62621 [Nephila pilipes]|uniref:Uncharacterized protein n=1 Tax=Nephila pilipes TaxID=299642 RepID=A0A8X6MVX3_NEPPI|nr:hypothetical protein NPIL_62621 [Nephila pilipes]